MPRGIPKKKKKVNFDFNLLAIILTVVLLVSIAVDLWPKEEAKKSACWQSFIVPPYSYIKFNACTGETKQGIIDGSKKFIEWQRLGQSQPKQIS